MPSPIQQALLMASAAGGGGGGGGPCDPYFSNVVLLMGFEGINGSTGAPGMNDESPSAHGTATISVNAQISTAQSKFGASSLLTASTNDGVFYPNSTDWNLSNFNSDQFTIELWARWNTLTTGKGLVAHYGGFDGSYCFVFANDNTAASELVFGWSPTGAFAGVQSLITSGAALTTGAWFALAVDKDATGKIRIYVNGVMKASATPANSVSQTGYALSVGFLQAATDAHDGWIDEVRITKGVARYASDSGYTVPIAAFPRVVCSTTWNPADLSADITLSNGNLTATKGSTVGNNAVRSNTTKNSGKLYVEFATGTRFAGGNTGVGAADAAAVLTSFGVSAVGGTGAFVGGGIFFNGSAISNLGTVINAGDVVAMAIDFVNSKVWYRLNGGNWNGDVIANQNPATNTGGVNIAALFPSNAAYLIFCSNDNPAGAPFTAASLRTTNAQFGFAKPSGFTSWDGV